MISNTLLKPVGLDRFDSAVLRIVVLLAVLFCSGRLLSAQQPDEPLVTEEKPTIEQIEVRKKQIAESPELTDEVKAKVQQLYDQALEELKAAEDFRAKAAQYEQQTGSVPQELTNIQAELAELPREAPQPNYEAWQQTPLPELDQKLDEQQDELQGLKQQLADLASTQNSRPTLKKEASEFLTTAPEKLAQLQADLEKLKTSEDPQPLLDARRTLLLAQQDALKQKMAALQNQLALFTAEESANLLSQRHDLLTRKTALLEQQVEALRNYVNNRERVEAEQRVQQAQREAAMVRPEVLPLAETNEQLAKQAESLTETIQQTQSQLQQVRSLYQEVRSRFQRVRDMIDSLGGLTDPVGQLLRRHKGELPNTRRYREQIATHQQTRQDIQVALFELKDERSEIANVEAKVQEYLVNLPTQSSVENPDGLKSAVRELLEKQRDQLDLVISKNNAYFDALVELDGQLQLLIDETRTYRDFINERVLWIRSQSRMDAVRFSEFQEPLAWLVEVGHWRNLAHALLAGFRRNPVECVLVLGLFALWIGYRRRLRIQLLELSDQRKHFEFRPTLQALLLTMILVFPGPAFLWYLSWWLARTPAANSFSDAVSAGLATTAALFLPLEAVRKLCARGGLAESHFNWYPTSVRLLRKHLRWLTIVALPLAFLTATINATEEALWLGSLGRTCFIVGMLGVSLFAQRTLNPRGGVMHPVIAYHRETAIDRFKYLWYVAAVVAPLVIALMAAWGYYYTAGQLAWRLQFTVRILFGTIVVRAILFRWVLVNRRQLAVGKSRDRSESQQRSVVRSEESQSSTHGPTIEKREVDLSAVSDQTRRLMHTVLLAFALIGIWVSWVDVLPALGMLNRLTLWAGAEEVGDVTAADLALTLVIAAITVIASRNVPGLLEIGLLQSAQLDAGIRYAITRLASYSIVIVGLLTICGLLGLSWSSVQWLAAAITVGLGFGLQEIFANFVSGLIILFEQPMRVGDIVTIDQTTGWVSRIRIRATTIRQWDRKELVVPNKEFVTGRLLNWTLSDQVNRPNIEVGIAYGSDTEKARQLLLKVASEHPLVLNDPPPLAHFMGFGDNSLNFVLRPFLPNMDNYLSIIHELHSAIDDEFRNAGIEIAFPQRDLHLRSVPAGWSTIPSNGSASGDDAQPETPQPASRSGTESS